MTTSGTEPLIAPLSPAQCPSIPAALVRTAERWPDRGVHFYDKAGVKSFITFTQIVESGQRVAQSLLAQGCQPGERVMMVLPNGFDFITTFIGALMAGMAPIPIPPPRSGWKMTRAVAVLAQFTERLGARALVVPPASDGPLLALAEAQSHVDHIAPVDTLLQPPEDAIAPEDLPWHKARPDDIACIQCTSGTTGQPRGVLLTHANVLSNIDAVGKHIGVTEEDVGVSWLPMIHDMGLFGVLMFSLAWGVPLVLLSPERFLKAPHEWLWCINNHGGTLSPASDFGFHYTARRARASDLEGLDLSTWRVAMNGSEAVDPDHIRAFERRLTPFGLRPNIIAPTYGLAEATLAVTFGAIDAPLRVDRIARDALELHGLATPAPEGVAGSMEVASVGRPLPCVEIALFDQNGEPCPDRTLGEVLVKGVSVTRGYCNPAEGEGPDEDGFIRTGDLGYTIEGELFVIGRRSEAINLGSRVIYPSIIETLVGRIDGVRSGSVVAFGVHRSAAVRSNVDAIRAMALADTTAVDATETHEATALHGPECLIVAVEASQGIDPEALSDLVRHALLSHLGIHADDVRVLSPRSIPRTRSGKLRRAKSREFYLSESLDRLNRQEHRQAITNLTERARSYVAQLGRRIRHYFDE